MQATHFFTIKRINTGFFLGLLLLLCLPVAAPAGSVSHITCSKSCAVLSDASSRFTLPDSAFGDVWSDADLTDDDDTIDSIAKQVSFAGSVLFLFLLFHNAVTAAFTRYKPYSIFLKLPDARSFLQVFRI